MAPGGRLSRRRRRPTRSGCSPKAISRRPGPAAEKSSCAGLFDKIHAEPQIAKRAEYKSAADMYMEKDMTAPDREQLNALMQSWYDAALGRHGAGAAFDAQGRCRRRLTPARNSPKTRFTSA